MASTLPSSWAVPLELPPRISPPPALPSPQTVQFIMHASRLVDLAASVASQHRLLCQQKVSADFWAADQFWVLTRARLNEWARTLKNCESLKTQDDDFDPVQFWDDTYPVIEEVLLSEICTRIWCATLTTIENLRHPGELDPIARSVFISSLEARRRALRLILFAKSLPDVATTTINSLRMNCEIWTDHLLADLSMLPLSKQYCFDRRRLERAYFARQNQDSLRAKAMRREARVLALRYTLSSRIATPEVCSELNSEIAAVILSCLPWAAFDGSGVQQIDLPFSTGSEDKISLEILADLYGTSNSSRYHATRGLKDRR